jgi:DNA-binding SARP family transcriptional activator
MAQPEFAFRLSGPLSAERDGRPVPLGIAGATRGLLAYLLIHPNQTLRKEHLTELLWPMSEAERRRSALNSAVHRVRKAIGGLPAAVVCGGETLCLMLSGRSRIDAATLRLAVEAAEVERQDAEFRELEGVLASTDRPFLEDIDESWAIAARERLFELRVRGLALVMRWHAAARRYDCALEIGREIVASDPLRETIQCEVMWLYVLNGERARALRQYSELERLLAAELAISPMEETRAMHEHIRFGLKGTGARPGPAGGVPLPLGLAPVVGSAEIARPDHGRRRATA